MENSKVNSCKTTTFSPNNINFKNLLNSYLITTSKTISETPRDSFLCYIHDC